MKKQDISVIDLLALIDIIDDYEQFDKDLMYVLGTKNSIDTLAKIRMYSLGERGIYPKKVKEFCAKHKDTLDKINAHVNVQSFIYHSYDFDKNSRIYQYLNSHRDSLDTIREVVLKLKELGVDKIELDESFDFSNNKYYMYTWSHDNTSIHFIDGIEAIPGYQTDKIYYVTNGSDFEIKFGMDFGQLSKTYNTAKVRSLTFDKAKLPDSVSKTDVTEPILKARDAKIADYDAIRRIVDMRLIEVDLRSKLERLDKVMENVDSFSNARADLVEIRALLINIQNELKKYEAEVIASSSYITAEVLDEEVKAYERRKRDSEIHIW